MQLILESKRQVDQLVHEITTLPLHASHHALQHLYDTGYQRALRIHRRYRLSLFLLTVGVIGGTAGVIIFTLRRSAQDLHGAKLAADYANQAKSHFLASINHELRTPLNAILGFIQLLLRDENINSEQRHKLDIIGRNSDYLLGLINDVLALSQIEAGRLSLHQQALDLYQLCDNLEHLLSQRATLKGLELLTTRSPRVPQYIVADEIKLRQVLINLIGNAVKFTDIGHVHVQLDYERPNLRIRVEDTGPGMTDAELTLLYEPFVQTSAGKKSQQGSGLGLSISRQYVRLMGGELHVQSQQGQGTAFMFDLPIVLADPEDVPDQRRTPAVVSLAPGQPAYRILIVEDRESSRQYMMELLSDAGFMVKEATQGREALEIWKAWRPHLIWMDMQMPVMDGYEATRQIKAHADGSSTVILALTANSFEEAVAEAREAGCHDVVLKPVPATIIFDKMIEHLGVQYTDHASEARADTSGLTVVLPSSDVLAGMSENWIAALQHAARSADAEQIAQLCQDIPDAKAPLNDILTHYVQHFRFDKITALTQRT